MMNSDLVLQASRATLASTLLGRRDLDDAGRIDMLYDATPMDARRRRPKSARAVGLSPRGSRDALGAEKRSSWRDVASRPGRRFARRSWRRTNSSIIAR